VIVVDTPPPVRAVFTTRTPEGDLGTTGPEPVSSAVIENRLALCATLGFDPDQVVMGQQVHGADVHAVNTVARPGNFASGQAGRPGDGLATHRPGVALAVMGADCLPVLLWRADGSAVAAAHAGWRGLVSGVVENTARALGPSESLQAVIGPGIGPCCYRVSNDVRQRFSERFGAEVVRDEAVDLAAAARTALCTMGIDGNAIITVQACTHCDADRFFSYRREGDKAGRQAGLIWMET
jgi:YfiH family protein